MIHFSPKYFYGTVLLLTIEVLIAQFMHDQFIRPFVGDVLVVILIYSFVRAFWRVPANATIGAVFLFACGVEGLQYLDIVDRLGLRQSRVLAVIIGSVFDWQDILAYALGSTIVFGWENRASNLFNR